MSVEKIGDTNDQVVYYCNFSSGDDSDDGSYGSPFKTLAHAFSKIADGTINDGDQIRILTTEEVSETIASTHTSTIEALITGANPTNGLVDGTRQTLKWTGDDVSPMITLNNSSIDYLQFANLILDGNATGTTGAEHGIEASVANMHNMSFMNMRFTNFTDSGVMTNNNANYWNFIRCRFDHNGESGLEATSTFFAVIHECCFDSNGHYGANVGSVGRINNSVFNNNGNDGARLHNAGLMLSNCIFHGNTGDGLTITGSGASTITNCVWAANQGHGIVPSSSARGSRVYNSTFYSNRQGDYYASGSGDDYLVLMGYTPGASGHNPDYLGATGDLNFTPSSQWPALGSGVPSPFKYMGITAADPGYGNYTHYEDISIF
tara:strand:+ start:797 stop:1927 length:1131 start_codon:yes stop_codon:yes gene_type:complete